MPKGHSTYETRLKEVEEHSNKLHLDLLEQYARMQASEKITDELLTRLQSLELRFKDYRVSTADTAVQNVNMTYKPQFEKWPGNGSQP
jgi:hypothetical protein